MIESLPRLFGPRDRGAPHAAPFAGYNAELRSKGPGKPVLLLDLDALDANIDAVRSNSRLPVRVVTKSLPSIPLLRHVMQRLGTGRLMVFDDTVALLARELPEADILLGKPLPVQAASAAIDALRGAGAERAAERVRWLIDSERRLRQYADLARERRVQLRIAIEVDVGLRRGGITAPDALAPLLDIIARDPDHLTFAGLMGYDAHAMSAPWPLSTPEKEMASIRAHYSAFRRAARDRGPTWQGRDVIFNGGGSKTYALYDADGPFNEVALGSALVKPMSFDAKTLADLTPALFIAAPVLKRLPGTRIPFLERLSGAWSRWDPNRQITYFIFGGGWMAKPVSPAGLIDNPLYGFSTNQAILNGSERTALSEDDWIFFRPTQSERVMQEFGSIHLARGGALEGTWDTIDFTP